MQKKRKLLLNDSDGKMHDLTGGEENANINNVGIPHYLDLSIMVVVVIWYSFPASKKVLCYDREALTLYFSFKDAKNRNFVNMNKRADFILLMRQMETPYIPTS